MIISAVYWENMLGYVGNNDEGVYSKDDDDDDDGGQEGELREIEGE